MEKTSYPVYTIKNGSVSLGAEVETFTLKAGISIPAILVGENGRGRKLGVLPVQLLPDAYNEWKESGRVFISYAYVGETKAGRPKLFQTAEPDSNDFIIAVFRTKIGFRGSNHHRGDETHGWERRDFMDMEQYDDPRYPAHLVEKLRKEGFLTAEEGRQLASAVGKEEWQVLDRKILYNPFPGTVIVKGIIAQGVAGRMGSGEQLVALMPKGVVFCTRYYGRLYGNPSAHYYLWDGEQLLSATKEEREVADLF